MRRARRLVVALVAIAAIAVAAAGAWLAFSPSATRWLVRELVERSEGRLAVAAVDGTLARGVSIAGVEYRQIGLRVTIDRMQSSWSWAALLNRHVQFRRLALGRVNVWFAPGDEPARLPADMGIPLDIIVDSGQIEQIAVVSADRRVVVEAIEFRSSSGAANHRIDLVAARVVQGRVAAQLNIEAKAPFALRAQAMFSPQGDDSLPESRLTLSGSLTALRADFRAQAHWLLASGSAELSPFAPITLKRLDVSAEKLLPQRLFPDAPRAELRGSLALRQVGAGSYEGELALENADPGDLGERKLPVTALGARFGGTIDALDLSTLELRMSRGPALTGQGRLASGVLDLMLNARGLDLKLWDKRLVSTRLGGSMRVQADSRTQSVVARLAQADYRIEIDASRRDDTLTLRRVSAAARGGMLTLAGQVSLAGAHEFGAKGSLRRFDPSAFWEMPPARIDAEVSAQGALTPEWRARVGVRASGVGPRGVAFAADANATLRPRRIADVQGGLTVGRNEVTVSGAYGDAADVLTFDANLRALNELDARFGGALAGNGRIAGDIARPDIRVEVRGTRLTGPGKLRFGGVQLRATIPNDWDQAIELQASAADLQIGTTRVDKAAASVRGTPRAHVLEASARGRDIDAALRLSGGLSTLRAWQGEIARIDVQKPIRVSMRAPAQLSLAPERIEIGGFTLNAMQAQISFDRTLWIPSGFASSGTFAGLQIAPLMPSAAAKLRSTLALAGNWKIEERLGMLNGGISLARDNGDIVMTGDTELPLALSALQVHASVENNRIRATAHVSSASLGELSVSLATELARNEGFWAVGADAPLTVDAKGEFPSIAWIGPLIHPGLTLAGSASLHASARGTLRVPKMQGAIEGRSLALRVPATGVALVDGELKASIEDERLLVQSLRFRGGDGSITAQGEVGIRKGPTANLRLKARQLTVFDRRDAQLELDADGEVATADGAIRIKGDVRVTRAHFDLLRRAEMPRLAEDIRIKGAQSPEASRQPLRWSIDLSTDFGNRFSVAASRVGPGSGTALNRLSGDFKARIEGRIHTRSDAEQIPQTTGRLNVVDGSYAALGRQFSVQRGNLNFVGPLANPALDIFVAPVQSTIRFTPEVGISITGTARAPRVRLVSQPDLPETEKLSWLLFGRGGRATDYTVGTAGNQISAPVTEFGWQLSQNLYLAYEQSATGTANIVRVYSRLSDRIAVQAGAGDASSLFVLYTFTFE